MPGGSSADGASSGFSALVSLLGVVLLGYFALPLVALVVAGSPAAVGSLGEPFVVRAAVHTLLTATTSTLLALGFGVPLGLWLARATFRGRSVVTALVVFPLVLPPVVSGMLLLSIFGESFLGGLTGVQVSRTLAGVVLAQTFVSAPFVVLVARSTFEGIDRTFLELARTLGASEWQAFYRVTLPLGRRGILAGGTLAFARAAGEFGATLMLAYYPRTLPVQIWVTFQSRGLSEAFPVALLLVGLAVGTLALVGVLGGAVPLWADR